MHFHCGEQQVLITGSLLEYFVMGDDRNSSEDSRNYGVIGRDRILGKVVWPQRLGLVAHARGSETLAGRLL